MTYLLSHFQKITQNFYHVWSAVGMAFSVFFCLVSIIAAGIETTAGSLHRDELHWTPGSSLTIEKSSEKTSPDTGSNDAESEPSSTLTPEFEFAYLDLKPPRSLQPKLILGRIFAPTDLLSAQWNPSVLHRPPKSA